MKKEYILILFIISLLLLNLFTWVFWGEFVYGFPSITKFALSALATAIIIYYRIVNPKKPDPGGLFYLILLFLIAWSVVLLVSVIINPHSELFPTLSFTQRVFGQANFFLPYLLPIFILYSRFDIDFFGYMFRISYVLMFFAVLIQLYTIATGVAIANKEQQSRVMIFNLAGGFLLMTSHLSRKKLVFYIALLNIALMIFLYAQWGRRAMLLDSLMIFFAALVMRLRTTMLGFHDRVKMYFAGLILTILIIQVGHLVTSAYVFQRGFTKESHEETRGFVYEAFFTDFNTVTDWVFGRGLTGTVSRDTSTDRIVDFVESGYLVLLFKGGLLYLIPFLLLVLRASYLGFYRSNNDLAKALAILNLIYLLSMYAWNWPIFELKYIFLWVSLSACFNSDLRTATNKDLIEKMEFRNKSA